MSRREIIDEITSAITMLPPDKQREAIDKALIRIGDAELISLGFYVAGLKDSGVPEVE